MIITNKTELEKVAKFLQNYDCKDNDLHVACTNVSFVLTQALESYNATEQHEELTLQIVEEPTLLEIAVKESCTTDCALYRQGTCRFAGYEQNCPRVREFFAADEETEY